MDRISFRIYLLILVINIAMLKEYYQAGSMVVVYDDPSIDKYKLNTIELYEGFVASRNESVSYTLDGIKVAEDPEAKFSMLIWEGDLSLGRR